MVEPYYSRGMKKLKQIQLKISYSIKCIKQLCRLNYVFDKILVYMYNTTTIEIYYYALNTHFIEYKI